MPNIFETIIEIRQARERAGYVQRIQVRQEQLDIIENTQKGVRYYKKQKDPVIVMQSLYASAPEIMNWLIMWHIFWGIVACMMLPWDKASSFIGYGLLAATGRLVFRKKNGIINRLILYVQDRYYDRKFGRSITQAHGTSSRNDPNL